MWEMRRAYVINSEIWCFDLCICLPPGKAVVDGAHLESVVAL